MRSLILPIALLALSGPLAAQQRMDAAGEKAVMDIVHAFHEALAAGDSTAAIGMLDPTVIIFEGGRAETLTDYRGGHLPADMSFAAATRREASDESVTLLGDAALYTASTHTRGRVRERDVDARGAETLVLTRTADGWRIRHIHWSSRR